jgi:AcrR family transcriptional regulator
MDDLGLRARKMARTRSQIADAAIRLFVAQGYDATTLDEIAEAADVHKRTLLRYFATKAHLVLHSQYEALDLFKQAMAERGDKKTIDVWTDHVVDRSRKMASKGPLAATRALARNEPAVVQAYLGIEAQYQGIIAEGLAADHGVDPARDIRSQVAAAALVGGNYAVGHAVMERQAYEELESSERQVIAMVRQGILGEA